MTTKPADARPLAEKDLSQRIDYYYAPVSPWTYLGHERFARLVEQHEAKVRLLPIDLGQVFPVSGGLPLAKRAPQRQAYRLVELQRFARHLGLPLNLQPRYFPVAGAEASRLLIAVDRLDGTVAAMRLGGALLAAVWAQERDIADLAVLAALLQEQGLSAQRLHDARDTEVQVAYDANTREAIASGIFGVPSYVVDGEIFWGQDRLDFLERRLQPNRNDKEKPMGEFIDLKAADGTVFPAYVARPTGMPRAGVVVVPEIFGVNSHIRSVADGYAQEGYLAVAPDTFHRVKPQVQLGYSEDDMKAGFALKMSVEALPQPGVMQDLQAAVDHAAQAGKVGIVGYCWGGLLTWRAASQLKGLAAAVPYYGGGVTTPDEVARIPQVPVMAHFGDQDHWIPLDSVESFKRAHPDVTVHIYPANHGFNCDQRASYNADAAMLARERTLAFFGEHLG
jgi:carboxymethylenebutenolidase